MTANNNSQSNSDATLCGWCGSEQAVLCASCVRDTVENGKEKIRSLQTEFRPVKPENIAEESDTTQIIDIVDHSNLSTNIATEHAKRRLEELQVTKMRELIALLRVYQRDGVLCIGGLHISTGPLHVLPDEQQDAFVQSTLLFLQASLHILGCMVGELDVVRLAVQLIGRPRYGLSCECPEEERAAGCRELVLVMSHLTGHECVINSLQDGIIAFLEKYAM